MSKINIPISELHFSFSRASGAGGQNVNKVNTKVILYWNLFNSPSLSPSHKERFKNAFSSFILENGDVQIVSQRHRSQKGNIDDAIEKLHQMIEEVAVAPKIRRATKPKRSAVLKRLSSKKKDSDKKRMRRNDY